MTQTLKTVLCVDDEKNGLFLRKKVLEKAGYNVVTAYSGEEALHIYESQPVDAVILDYYMGGMNGLKVASRLKEMGSQIPIIMLSAYGSLLDEALGLVDLWLTKASVDPGQLATIIRGIEKTPMACRSSVQQS